MLLFRRRGKGFIKVNCWLIPNCLNPAAQGLHVRLEYAGIQCPEDKPYVEPFFGSYKTEELYRNEYNNLAEARTGWESYRTWYRNDRLHQALWNKNPRDYAKITFQSKLLVV